MTYQDTLDYLFNALPMFQRIGAAAFKKDLSNTIKLCAHLDDPQHRFKSIHIAGTNGKGSSSHMIAAVLQEAGYKVGLYTSPHLKSFTERIKINGQEIPEKAVVDFVEKNRDFLDELKPSFFEMTVGLAFVHFANEQVDYAVVEVGMGGRLDSTNVILPEVCLITNIGLDHTQFLGTTLTEIAGEKAGIIKQEIPVVISQNQPETFPVFQAVAMEKKAPIFYAGSAFQVNYKGLSNDAQHSVFQLVKNGLFEELLLDLFGKYQEKNLPGVLMTLEILKEKGLQITDEITKNALSKAAKLSGLKGRFQKLQEAPSVYCDTGHNAEGISLVMEQLTQMRYDKLYIIIGTVNDKDIGKVLEVLPKTAEYRFCQASIPRALPATALYEKATTFGLNGVVIEEVNQALEDVLKKAGKNDLIFIGGSTFVVAEIENL